MIGQREVVGVVVRGPPGDDEVPPGPAVPGGRLWAGLQDEQVVVRIGSGVRAMAATPEPMMIVSLSTADLPYARRYDGRTATRVATNSRH